VKFEGSKAYFKMLEQAYSPSVLDLTPSLSRFKADEKKKEFYYLMTTMEKVG
jgi:hypothetical protein